MDEVAICIVTQNDFFTTKIVIERLLEKTNIKPRLYIVDNASTDQQLISYCFSVCSKNGGYLRILKEQKKYSEAINEMLRIVHQKYCVIFPTNILVNQNWLEDLIYNLKIVQSVGITSIKSGNEKLYFMPLLHKSEVLPEDELKNILITENNAVEGIMCFERSKFDHIGFFDEKLQHKGFEQAEFCFRTASMGMNNIYIRKQSCVKIPLSNEMLFPKKTKEGMDEFKANVEWMIKNQMFKK
jgi:hypothetical protein